jgi:S-adenosylmethionine decarboxylase
MHLIIDGYGADRKKLEDLDYIYRLLDEYPATLSMHKIGPPHVVRYTGPKPEDWGISGFVLIAESHISIHTFPQRSYINIDVFSCMEFDPQKAIKDLTKRFRISQVRSFILERGLTYQHELAAMAEATKARRSDLVEALSKKDG